MMNKSIPLENGSKDWERLDSTNSVMFVSFDPRDLLRHRHIHLESTCSYTLSLKCLAMLHFLVFAFSDAVVCSSFWGDDPTRFT